MYGHKGLDFVNSVSNDERAQCPHDFHTSNTEVITHQLLSWLYLPEYINCAPEGFDEQVAMQEQAIMHGMVGTRGASDHNLYWGRAQLSLGTVLSEREEGDLRTNL